MHAHTHGFACDLQKFLRIEVQKLLKQNSELKWKQKIASNTVCLIKIKNYKEVRREGKENISLNKLTVFKPFLEFYLETQSKYSLLHLYQCD